MGRLSTGAALLGLALFALAGRAAAELPPTAYERMRQEARYVLVLDVRSVGRSAPKVEGDMRTTRVTVRARILSVIRGSGMKTGGEVTIVYDHREPVREGWVGPSPVPILKRETRVLAWLDPGSGALAPAARGRSFAVLR